MRHLRLTGIIKIGIPFLLAAIFLAGIAFPGAFALGQTTTPTATSANQMLFGQVVSIAADKTSFAIQTDAQTRTTVAVNQNTIYTVFTIPASSITVIADLLEFLLGSGTMPTGIQIATVFANLSLLAKSGSFNDITVGDMVSVSGASGTPAAGVNIIKYTGIGKAAGSISAVTATSISITPATGSAVTIKWDASTRFILHGVMAVQVGQTATILYDLISNTAVMVTIKAAATPTASPGPSPSPASNG